MKKTCISAIVMLLVALTSCTDKGGYESSVQFGWDDFAEVHSLKGKSLEFDSLIMKPRDLQVFDSVLVVIDYSEEQLFHLFNLKTKKKIGSRVVAGNGPNDMLRPKFVKGCSDMLSAYDLASSRIVWFDIPTFMNVPSPSVAKAVHSDKPFFVNVVKFGSQLLSSAYESDNYQLRTFDKDGKCTGELVPYPVSHINYSPAEQRDAYYMDFVGHGKNGIAAFYCMTDLFEIHDASGRLKKRMHGPDCFYPIFKEVRNGDVVTSSPDEEATRDAYFSPCAVGDKLFVLYDGDFLNNPNNDGSCSSLFVFSWDGTPEIRYTLDDPITSFCVDVKNRKVYGISKTPEYHIVEYSY